MAGQNNFWGVEVKGNKPCQVPSRLGYVIHVSQATLGDIKKDKETVIVQVKTSDKKLVMGMLNQDTPQLSSDLVFDEDFEISHNWKNGSIHVMGYLAATGKQVFETGDSDDDGESDKIQTMAEDEEQNHLPSINENESPWLLGININPNVIPEDAVQTFSINNNNYRLKKIHELQGQSIVASVMGWLILRDRKSSTMYSLWNPITRKSILLPKLLDIPEGGQQPTCVFTSPPDDDDCVLLLFSQGFVFMCSPTSRNWVKLLLKHDGRGVFSVRAAAVVDKDIYVCADLDDWEGDLSRVERRFFARVKFNFSGHGSGLDSVEFESLSAKCPTSMIVYHASPDIGVNIFIIFHSLIEVRGVLYAVTIIERLKVYVWKLDLSKMEWIQIDSLGDFALLLGGNCSTWCADGGRIEQNCLYMAYPLSDIIDQYRLQDSSHSILVSPLSRFNDRNFWFMPYNPARRLPSFLLQLPPEVMTDMSTSLHWLDCINLRATCKDLRTLIPKPKWKANSELPLLMFLKNNEGLCELWDPCYLDDASITKKLPYSISIISTIEFTKDGWLLMSSDKAYLQFINLVTGETGEHLGVGALAGSDSRFLFTSCPTDDDCITAGISAYERVRIGYFRRGNYKWNVADYEDPEELYFSGNYKSNPIYLGEEHGEAFYFLDSNCNLGVFKSGGEGNPWMVYKGPLDEEDSNNWSECYIADLDGDGELIYVFIQDGGYKLRVYTFDVDQELWAELKSLGKYTVFVSSASSFSVAAKDRSMSNRIYLPKRIGNEMIFYSLDTGKYHASRSKKSYENFDGMISQSFSCWV